MPRDDSAYEDYALYKAEARACGEEVVSFEEWIGDVNPREAAEHRIQFDD